MESSGSGGVKGKLQSLQGRALLKYQGLRLKDFWYQRKMSKSRIWVSRTGIAEAFAEQFVCFRTSQACGSARWNKRPVRHANGDRRCSLLTERRTTT